MSEQTAREVIAGTYVDGMTERFNLGRKNAGNVTALRWAVGIDPSLTATGIADVILEEACTVRKGEGDGRLDEIYQAVYHITARRNGVLAVVEDLPYNARSAGATGLAHGVVRLALIRTETPYILIPPATLKAYATGKGNATKPDMRVAWLKRTGQDVRDDNQVDALWLRDIGRYAIGDGDALELPKAQRERLFKLTWPPELAANMLAPYEVVQREVVV